MEANQDRMTTMNIALPEALQRFVESRAAQRDSSVSEFLLETSSWAIDTTVPHA